VYHFQYNYLPVQFSVNQCLSIDFLKHMNVFDVFLCINLMTHIIRYNFLLDSVFIIIDCDPYLNCCFHFLPVCGCYGE
jgi:hypothetical protein